MEILAANHDYIRAPNQKFPDNPYYTYYIIISILTHNNIRIIIIWKPLKVCSHEDFFP